MSHNSFEDHVYSALFPLQFRGNKKWLDISFLYVVLDFILVHTFFLYQNETTLFRQTSFPLE